MSHQINKLALEEYGQMEVKITQEQYNSLLKRKEITFEIDHSQDKGTPARLEIRQRLADILKIKPEVVYVKRMVTKAGTMRATGSANAYDSVEQAKLIELKYVIARNTPQEKKEEKEAPAAKPEAPKPPEKTEQPAKKEA
jgi:small subunit ribosomal protein S24e